MRFTVSELARRGFARLPMQRPRDQEWQRCAAFTREGLWCTRTARYHDCHQREHVCKQHAAARAVTWEPPRPGPERAATE